MTPLLQLNKKFKLFKNKSLDKTPKYDIMVTWKNNPNGGKNYETVKGESNKEEETLNRLNYIVSQKNNIYLTDLPKDILMCNGKPVGVEISYCFPR